MPTKARPVSAALLVAALVSGCGSDQADAYFEVVVPLYPDASPEDLADMGQGICDEAAARRGGLNAWYGDQAIAWWSEGSSGKSVAEDLPRIVETAIAWRCPELLGDWVRLGRGTR